MSPDTAPPGYSVKRPAWTAGVVLLLFGVLFVLAAPLLSRLEEGYVKALPWVAGAEASDIALRGTVSFRPFFLVVMLTFAVSMAGPLARCLRLLAFWWSLYLGLLLAVDIAVLLTGSRVPSPTSGIGRLAGVVIGLLVVPLGIFTHAALPDGIRIRRRRPGSVRTVLTLVGAAGASALLAEGVLALEQGAAPVLSDMPLLGGLASRVALFAVTMTALLSLIGRMRSARPRLPPTLRERRDVIADTGSLSVAFLVPAFNERESIEACIRAVDRAAAGYSGPCRLYLVDNGSRDGTPDIARQALARCRSLSGEVLECPERGKARALNFGLRHTNEALVIRIDADTTVSPDLLPLVVSHLADPGVGGVGGIALPSEKSSLIGRIRTVEVTFNVAFVRLAHASVDAVMVLPGVMAAYRRKLLLELGGFAEGINGEDADITVRIGRLGYRIVVDPRITVRTEVPRTLPGLFEQRQRWARGIFHVGARNRSMIRMRQGIRGVWMLPWAIFNACRRGLVLPALLAVALLGLLDRGFFSPTPMALLGGVVIGVRTLLITAVLVGHREFRALLYLPAYFAFQVFLAYVSLHTLLTLALKKEGHVSPAGLTIHPPLQEEQAPAMELVPGARMLAPISS